MSKKSFEPMVSRHVDLYKSDWDFLEAHFGRDSATKIGVGRMVREILHRKVKKLQAMQVSNLDEMDAEGNGE